MSSVYRHFIQKEDARTVLNYQRKSASCGLKAVFCLNVYLVRLPKSHGKREGLVGRCLRDNGGLSQSLKEGDNTCRLQSKSPFTVGMECVTKAVMQAICLDVHPPSHPECNTVHLFQPLGETLTFVWVSYVGIYLTVQLNV